MTKTPSPKMKKWEYLNSLELSAKTTRWEYPNSLDQELRIVIPNIAPADIGDDAFYNEPLSASDRSRPSNLAYFKYLCNPNIGIVLLVAILVASITTASVLVLKSTKGRTGSSASLESVSIEVSSILYQFNDEIALNVKMANPKTSCWIGVWEADKSPGPTFTTSDTPAAMWLDLCGEDQSCLQQTTFVFSENTGWKSDFVALGWPLCNGKWIACVINDDTKDNLGCSDMFVVYGGNCEGVCKPATEGVTAVEHLNPTPNTPLSKIAFGSCFEPGNQIDSRLWNHMRNIFQPDLWVWLGDNVYADGQDIALKRNTYNANKNDQYYLNHGPLAEPRIPVTGTWDDHDSGVGDSGAEYQCHKLAQDEFAYWFNLPEDDPRHPSQGWKQRKGVYSSIMFTKPGDANVNGVHLVLLDVRYFRSPTFKEKGHCEGGNSTVLGEEQWKWLEQELKKKSKIKVIGTGMQVMQPTDQTFTDVDSYCANDGKTFFDVIDQLGEDKRFLGTKYEGWNQIPQEKARLLRLLQRTIANGDAEKIIIISGDMHWGEMMAKKMSAAAGVGPSQVIYEVTASGIDKNFPYPDSNANRLRIRSADSVGDGVFQHECKFPFKSEGIEYNDCISTNEEVPWCATIVDSENNYFPGDWGYCLPEDQELVPRANITASGENSCYEKLHVCKARANYGGIEVDWDNSVIKLSLFTPHANDNVAAQVTIGL